MQACRAFLLSAVLSAAAVGQAAADDRNGAYQSFGAPTCERYLSQRVGRPDTAAAWIDGWLTGYNVGTPNTNSLIAPRATGSLMTWLDGWCRDHRARHLADAMAAFAYEAYPRRLTEPPPR